jgi:gliding motility-associated-like protein
LFFTGYGQLFVQGNYSKLSNVSGLDYIILFSKIDNSSEIHFKADKPNAVIRWFTFSNGNKIEIQNFSSLSSSHSYIDPKHNTGYVVSADGVETTCWIFDKSIESNSRNLFFENLKGEKFNLFQETRSENNQSVTRIETASKSEISSQEPIQEIGCRITTTTEVRDSLNENQRPKETSLEGSAPLIIDFFSNPTGDVRTFLWQIYKDGNLILSRTEQNHQYTFSETGKYKVRLQVSNPTEMATDSVEVSISESSIAVPRVFTPNDDGINDEFRVAYTSITEFNATILNRWGRVVYKWTNPQTGWDGKIGGKPAPEGTYFYFIQAKGADGKPFERKGHVTLLR